MLVYSIQTPAGIKCEFMLLVLAGTATLRLCWPSEDGTLVLQSKYFWNEHQHSHLEECIGRSTLTVFLSSGSPPWFPLLPIVRPSLAAWSLSCVSTSLMVWILTGSTPALVAPQLQTRSASLFWSRLVMLPFILWLQRVRVSRRSRHCRRKNCT